MRNNHFKNSLGFSRARDSDVLCLSDFVKVSTELSDFLFFLLITVSDYILFLPSCLFGDLVNLHVFLKSII